MSSPSASGDRACLGMYPLPELVAGYEALWAQVVRRVAWLPTELSWPDDIHATWVDPEYLVNHTCGWPLVTSLAERVQVVGAFHPGLGDQEADGHRYRSIIVVRRPDVDLALAREHGLSAGLRPVANSPVSLSGWISLRWTLPWVTEATTEFVGSHLSSLTAVAEGRSDIASIDAVSFHHIARHRPELVDRLRLIGHGPWVPSLPVVARHDLPMSRLAELRAAFAEVVADPAQQRLRTLLCIAGFSVLTIDDYGPVRALVALTRGIRCTVVPVSRLRPKGVRMVERDDGVRRRRGGRSESPRSTLPVQRSSAQPRLRFAPTAAVSADELESIHLASLLLLQSTGMDVLDDGARELLRRIGADVRPGETRVRFDPDLVMGCMATAPAEFTFHSWNPDRNLRIGGDWMAFGTVASAPNVVGRGRGRRTGNRQDYQDLLRLAHSLNTVHFISGYPVEPVDIHASVRHLDATFDALTLTDRPIHAYSLGRQRVLDCLEAVRIARGVSDADLDVEPSLFTIVNTNSPLRLDIPMSHGIMELSARNQIVCITPFTLSGAMAPVTLAGALVQQNAEALMGMMFTQVVRPGSPVIYGGFTSNVDMQSGSPAFGTPEYVRTAMVGGQLARRYNVPYRSSNVCAANAVDAQAAYESVFSLWGAVMGGVNLLMHGAGWMEGGLHASYEKMVLDADLLQMVSAMMDPVVVDDDTMALAAIDEVGPGGHFFGVQHTQDRYRTAFYKPMISDWRNFETWAEAGSPTAFQRAEALVEQFLGAYEPPPLPEGRREELEAFVERRKADGGVPTDF